METVRYKRLPQLLKDVGESVTKVATKQFEDETDVYFTLLADHLHAKRETRYKKLVDVWKEKDEYVGPLSPDVCLSLRADSIQ